MAKNIYLDTKLSLQPPAKIVNAVVKRVPPSKPTEHKITGKQNP